MHGFPFKFGSALVPSSHSATRGTSCQEDQGRLPNAFTHDVSDTKVESVSCPRLTPPDLPGVLTRMHVPAFRPVLKDPMKTGPP